MKVLTFKNMKSLIFVLHYDVMDLTYLASELSVST